MTTIFASLQYDIRGELHLITNLVLEASVCILPSPIFEYWVREQSESSGATLELVLQPLHMCPIRERFGVNGDQLLEVPTRGSATGMGCMREFSGPGHRLNATQLLSHG